MEEIERFTVEDIQEMCEIYANALNVMFDCPIYINGRLSTTLGRVMYEYDEPVRMEFSASFLKTASEWDIEQVILHEFCHWYVSILTGEPHGHDSLFKEACATVGCEKNGTKSKIERIKAADTDFKYSLYCPECGWCRGYKTRCERIKHPDWYMCGKCHTTLMSRQNF